MPLARLLGDRLLQTVGQAAIPTVEALAGASAVGLYFSASWCPPCRGFTPQLKASYAGHLEAKGMRCVLISSDRDESSFDEYFGSMPWLALPYAERPRKEALSAYFGVQTIPTLAMVDAQGRILTTEARNAVVADPEGSQYPWADPPFKDLASGEVGRINTAPSVVLLCEGPDAEAKRLAGLALGEAAARSPDCQPPWESRGGGAFDLGPGQGYAFFVATGGEIAAKVRQMAGLPALEADGAPRLLLLDIPDGGAFYLGPEGAEALTAGAVDELLAGHAAGRLQRRQLS
ncbi:unnamed protein product [Prorocentrum cordatum]|uniref:Thioredoxin domain-containing protein n=1 Tax=Prorocentrum cordatum TaxID=2364126 RepID=A0ABN9SCE5_9DINO|nr:unnamed protein product [Polarella glacialis]|mmetsp:Transcript_15882/g.42339  ORF Transcript_15882/g.42339 Transcript_15882/m.42339 type:complete len:289 (-) Transcript_15882:23-889(-)